MWDDIEEMNELAEWSEGEYLGAEIEVRFTQERHGAYAGDWD